MNIYFSCSITGGRAEEDVYQAIVQAMLDMGHEVPTAHLSSPEVMEMEKVVNPAEIFERDMNWLRECDVVVAEVTSPSHGVGYEIAYALSLGKPVFCCHKAGRKVSMILTGNPDPNLTLRSYNSLEGAVSSVKDFLAAVKRNS